MKATDDIDEQMKLLEVVAHLKEQKMEIAKELGMVVS